MVHVGNMNQGYYWAYVVTTIGLQLKSGKLLKFRDWGIYESGQASYMPRGNSIQRPWSRSASLF